MAEGRRQLGWACFYTWVFFSLKSPIKGNFPFTKSEAYSLEKIQKTHRSISREEGTVTPRPRVFAVGMVPPPSVPWCVRLSVNPHAWKRPNTHMQLLIKRGELTRDVFASSPTPVVLTLPPSPMELPSRNQLTPGKHVSSLSPGTLCACSYGPTSHRPSGRGVRQSWGKAHPGPRAGCPQDTLQGPEEGKTPRLGVPRSGADTPSACPG